MQLEYLGIVRLANLQDIFNCQFSTSVKTVISRCIEIFDQRKVFPSHIIEEMRAALGKLFV
jgi:hypothetical protein